MEKLDGKLDSKIIKFIEDNIKKGKYIEKNIQISEETVKEYFVFQLRTDNESYSIFAKENIEMPKEILIPSLYANKPVISIGRNAFCNSENRVIRNKNIEIVTIPETITNIADEAFSDCTNLKKVTIYGNRVPTIGKKVFMNTSKDLVIYVPAEMVDAYKNAPGWSEYKEKISPADTPLPEEPANQDGIVNTVVTTIVDSKEVSISYNFYFLNINNSNVNNSDKEQ